MVARCRSCYIESFSILDLFKFLSRLVSVYMKVFTAIVFECHFTFNDFASLKVNSLFYVKQNFLKKNCSYSSIFNFSCHFSSLLVVKTCGTVFQSVGMGAACLVRKSMNVMM